jgi:hypothetical protein
MIIQNKDAKHLEILYEEVKFPNLDYLLLEDKSNFDWDEFFHQFNVRECMYQDLLCEAFELSKSDSDRDIYTITTTAGAKFRLSINFTNKESFDSRLMNMYLDYKGSTKIIDSLKNTINKTQQPIIHLVFEDEEHNLHKTGKGGNYTYSILSGVKRSIQDSFKRRNYVSDVIFYQVRKNEIDRKELYEKFFGRNFLLYLNNKFVNDKISEFTTEIYYWQNI